MSTETVSLSLALLLLVVVSLESMDVKIYVCTLIFSAFARVPK